MDEETSELWLAQLLTKYFAVVMYMCDAKGIFKTDRGLFFMHNLYLIVNHLFNI